MPVPITSLSLLARARAHEPAAWNRIVDLYAPLVYSWCRRQSLQEADALDVGQEVFRSVYVHLSAYRRDRPGDSFRGWLKTITRNKVSDARRRGRNRELAGGGVVDHLAQQPAGPPDPGDDDSERKAVLRRAMELVRGDVAPRTWAAFWLATIEGRPVPEVATELGVSENAVYLAKSRTVRRLRAMYGELVEGLDDGAGTGG
ncbi:MAG: sigma-70 family RNA polymerase sigma factor [Gemmataceae bacterium]